MRTARLALCPNARTNVRALMGLYTKGRVWLRAGLGPGAQPICGVVRD